MGSTALGLIVLLMAAMVDAEEVFGFLLAPFLRVIQLGKILT